MHYAYTKVNQNSISILPNTICPLQLRCTNENERIVLVSENWYNRRRVDQHHILARCDCALKPADFLHIIA